jgi:PAS domain S-box-containing protein
MDGKAESTARDPAAPAAGPTLRQQAEAVIDVQAEPTPAQLAAMSPEETQRMLHELGVHQIELEMQNEELRRTQAELSAARTRYFDLYDLAPVGYCTLDEQGQIRQANLTAASMLGVAASALRDKPLTAFICKEDQDIYYLHRKQRIEAGRTQACELRLVRQDGTLAWVHLATTAGHDADGTPELRVVLTDVTEHKQVEAALRASMRQLQTLSRRVLEAQETERRRVALELHDELGQALTAIKINLQVGQLFQKQTAGELNAENVRIVDEALQQMRRLAYALRPSMLDDLGLAPALRWMAEQTAARSGPPVDFDPGPPQPRLAPEIEIAVFRIAQEALTNVVRHAQARHVQMSLHRDGEGLVLRVQDDGLGFDPAAVRARALAGGSLGLLGMEERAMLIGGQLLIESAPGQGCTLRLHCPARGRAELP